MKEILFKRKELKDKIIIIKKKEKKVRMNI